MTYQNLLKICQKNKIKLADLKFCDLPGTWQHFAIPIEELSQKIFSEGVGFDGSSIRGFKEIQDSDMILVPDIKTFQIEPFSKIPTGSFICDVYEPGAQKRFKNDPRFVAQKAENYLKKTKIGDISYFGPEAEYFIFDGVKFSQDQNFSYYEINSSEANWRNNGEGNVSNGDGYKIRNKEGYFPVPPLDKLMEIRRETVLELQKLGVEVEREHHEVSTQ